MTNETAVTDEMRATWQAQLAGLDGATLQAKTVSLRGLIDQGRVPAAQLDGARELLTACEVESQRRNDAYRASR